MKAFLQPMVGETRLENSRRWCEKSVNELAYHFAGAGKVIAWFNHFANAGKMATLAKKTNESWQRNKLSSRTMRKKIIAKNLKKMLLEDGAFSRVLFEFDLEDRIVAYLQSKHEDGDNYLFVIAEKSNAIAMMLIDENDEVHVNAEARALLMKLWQGENYKNNVLLFMPDMANA